MMNTDTFDKICGLLIKEVLESYPQSLRLDTDWLRSKFNLSDSEYALRTRGAKQNAIGIAVFHLEKLGVLHYRQAHSSGRSFLGVELTPNASAALLHSTHYPGSGRMLGAEFSALHPESSPALSNEFVTELLKRISTKTFRPATLLQNSLADLSDPVPASVIVPASPSSEAPETDGFKNLWYLIPPMLQQRLHRPVKVASIIFLFVTVVSSGFAAYKWLFPTPERPKDAVSQATPFPSDMDAIATADRRLKEMYDLGTVLYSPHKGPSSWMSPFFSSQFELTDTADAGVVTLNSEFLTVTLPGFKSKRTGLIPSGIPGTMPMKPTWTPRTIYKDPPHYQVDLIVVDNNLKSPLYALGFKTPIVSRMMSPDFDFELHSHFLSGDANAPNTLLVEITLHNRGEPTTAEWASTAYLITPARIYVATNVKFGGTFELGDGVNSKTIHPQDWLVVKTSKPIGLNEAVRGFLMFKFNELPPPPILTEPTMKFRFFAKDKNDREAVLTAPGGGTTMKLGDYRTTKQGIPLPLKTN